ncbi:hypothetical protein IT571_11565 [Candidatus Sumerlaeota bacterium]|nr:hypothetical protein [Candidatus Sumerlaeota bacterium]
MISRYFHRLALLGFLAVTAAGSAITFQLPPYIVAPTTQTQAKVFAERYGANIGRVHIVYLAQNTSGGTGVFYTRETGVGNNVFTTPLLVSPLDNKTYNEPAISVDRYGTAHIVFIGDNPTNAANDSVFYGKVSSGGALTAAQKITPDSVVVAFSPQVAAVQYRGRSVVQPHVAYISNDIGGGIDTDVYLLTADPLNPSNFGTPLNLSADTNSSEQNLTFDLVEGLNSGSGPTDYNIQGALVYERSNTLQAIMVSSASSTSIGFAAVQQLISNAQAPALCVQSVFQSPNGYVGHLAFRPTQVAGEVNYMQFARDGSGTIAQEVLSSFTPATVATAPSVTVEPYLPSELTGTNFINARFDKDVSISYADQGSRSENAARNSGGISSSIATALGIVANVPLTPFTDTGFASFFPSTFFSSGETVIATTRINSVDYIRICGVLGNNVVLLQEIGVPTPTVTPTPTVSPTASVTPSATPSISPSPSAQPTSTAGTATPTASPTSAATATASPSPSPTPIILPTASLTASPTATPPPTASPFVTPTPSPSHTAGPTLTATPNNVTRVEIIDTLLGFRPAPSASRVAQHDVDANGFWDAGDVASFNVTK